MNGNEPAYPMPSQLFGPNGECFDVRHEECMGGSKGLTKREWLAGKIMAATRPVRPMTKSEALAKEVVEDTDALLAALKGGA